MYTAFLRCSPFSLPLLSLPPSFLTLPCLLTPYLTPPINGTAASPDGVGTSRAVPNVDEPPRDIPIPRLVKYLPRFLLRHRPFVHHWEHRRVIANDPTYNCRFKYTVSSVKGLRTYVRMCVHVCTYIYMYVPRDMSVIHIYTYVHTYIHTYVHTYIHTYVCISVNPSINAL